MLTSSFNIWEMDIKPQKNKQNNFLHGAVILSVAGIITKVIGAAFKIPLTNIIGAEGHSFYGVAYPVYQFFYTISTAGFPVAIAKMVSERIAIGDFVNARKSFKLAMKTIIVLCSFSFAIFFFCAGTIARIYKNPGAEASIRSLSFAFLFVAIVAPLRGFFQGMQNMNPTAFSNIVEQLVRATVGLALAVAFYKTNLEFAAAGATFGASAGMAVAAIVLSLFYFRAIGEFKRNEEKSFIVAESEKERLRELLSIVIPITIGSAVLPIMMNVDAVIVMRRLQETGWSVKDARSLYGLISGYCDPLANIPVVFIDAITISLLPAVSIAFSRNDEEVLKKTIGTGLKSIMLVAYPCAIGLIVLAGPILHTLFMANPEEAQQSIHTLQILSLGIIVLAAMRTLSACLQGVGRITIPVVNLTIGAVIKIIITYIMVGIPAVNVNGAAIGTVTAYGTAAVLNYYSLKKEIEFELGFVDTFIKPLLPAAVMGLSTICTYTLAIKTTSNNTVSTLISIVLAVIVYFVAAFFTRTVSEDDLIMIPMGIKVIKLAKKLHLLRK